MQFSSLIGQHSAKAHLIESFRNARLPHAIMLTGPPGIGKLGMATALAQYVNCLNPTEKDSCGTCNNCIKIKKGIHPDVNYILPIISKKAGGKTMMTEDFFEPFRESFFKDPYYNYEQWQESMDAQNKQLMISVHEVRALKKKVFLKAFEAEFKIIILWNAERIRVEAANAFLKLMEEPPDKTLIIMTCSDPSQLLITINSRSQHIRMDRISQEHIKDYLIGIKEIAVDRANEISAIAEGSIGNAKKYLEESQDTYLTLYMDWLRMIYTGHYGKIQEEVEKIYKQNKEFQKLFLTFALKKLRDSLLFNLDLDQLALVTEKEIEFQKNFSKLLSPEKVGQMADQIERSGREIGGNANPQLVFTALSLRLHAIIRS